MATLTASRPNVTMTDYQPVDCNTHSEYEAAIVRQRKMRVNWTDASGQSCIDILRPVDLLTRQHEEFMLAETHDHKIIEIRLDYINKAETL